MDTPISVRSVEAVRLTCTRCGVALIMPIDSTKEVPHKCFNCYHEFPSRIIQEFIRDFRVMREELGETDVTFMVHMEHDGKER